jgi:hypothetical protein
MANTQKKNPLTFKQAVTSVRNPIAKKAVRSVMNRLSAKPTSSVDKLFGRPIQKAPSGQAPTAMAKGGVARKTKKSSKKG